MDKSEKKVDANWLKEAMRQNIELEKSGQLPTHTELLAEAKRARLRKIQQDTSKNLE